MAVQHCNWRTVEEWKDLNVPLSTPSNEACKLYDAALNQSLSFGNDPAFGGLAETVQKMLEADPNFVVGHAMKLGMTFYGDGCYKSPTLKTSVRNLVSLADGQPNLAPCERKHVKAVELLADGYMKEACETWEAILVEHPLDVLALKSSYSCYISLGDSRRIRDSVARVLPHYKPSTPYYGYMLGRYAFGLEETNCFDQAEKIALKALDINRYDVWTTHTLTHLFESTGQQDRGIEFLEKTVDDWERGTHLACHNWWHLSLHYVEKGDYQRAIEIFETQVKERCEKQKEMFNVSDAAALLFRLQMLGVKVDHMWKEIQTVNEAYLDKRLFPFYDLTMMMSCLGSGDQNATKHLLDALEDFVRNGQGTCHDAHSQVGLKICQALKAYKEGDFATATDLTYPLRYDIFTVGGSHAQRDVFNLFLIMSALQSSKKEHHKIARCLLVERKACKENSPLTDRLFDQVVALHSD